MKQICYDKLHTANRSFSMLTVTTAASSWTRQPSKEKTCYRGFQSKENFPELQEYKAIHHATKRRVRASFACLFHSVITVALLQAADSFWNQPLPQREVPAWCSALSVQKSLHSVPCVQNSLHGALLCLCRTPATPRSSKKNLLWSTAPYQAYKRLNTSGIARHFKQQGISSAHTFQFRSATNSSSAVVQYTSTLLNLSCAFTPSYSLEEGLTFVNQ